MCVQAGEFLQKQVRPEPDSKGIEPFPLWAQRNSGSLLVVKSRKRFCGFSIKNGQRSWSRDNALPHWSGAGLPACTRGIWLTLFSKSLALLSCHRDVSYPSFLPCVRPAPVSK